MLMRNDLAWLDEQMRRLTPRQKDCLRLVAKGYQSKSIARELGISSLRVDKHIAEARRILGIASRHEAAKLFRAWELQQEAPTPSISWGAPGLALPESVKQPFNDGMDPNRGSDTAQMPTDTQPQEPHALNDGNRRPGYRSFRLERRIGRESRKPTTLTVITALVAVLGAVGAVAWLLFALDGLGRS